MYPRRISGDVNKVTQQMNDMVMETNYKSIPLIF